MNWETEDWQYTCDKIIPPPTTAYTIIPLRLAYILFLVSIILYATLLWIVKSFLSSRFKISTIWAKIQHVIEVLNIPDTFGDWISGQSSPTDCIKAWWDNLYEMVCLIALQLISNLALLAPLLVTGKETTFPFNSSRTIHNNTFASLFALGRCLAA